MASGTPEPEQLSLPAIDAPRPPYGAGPESARIADLRDRLARAETRMTDAIAHIRLAEAAAQRRRRQVPIAPRGWVGRLVDRLLLRPQRLLPSPTLPRLSIVTVTGSGTEDDAARRTVESVLAQSYPAAELIIVDLAEEIGRRSDWWQPYERHIAARIPAPGQSVEAGFALGLARATGDLLTVLLPGDRLMPGALGRVGFDAARHEEAAILVAERVVESGGWRFAGGPVEPASLTAPATVLPQGTFVRRHEFDLAGGLDVAFGGMPAPALWPRLLKLHAARILPGHAVLLPISPLPAERELPLYAVTASLWRQTMRRLRRRWRLSFPAGEAGPLPINNDAVPPLIAMRCPVSDKLPLALLFSSPDTRFGEAGLSEIWYHRDSHCAAIGPPLGPAERQRLAQRESHAEDRLIEPDPTAPSPFRGWRSPLSALGWLRDIGLPPMLDRWLVRWHDPTEGELRRMLKGFLPAGGKAPRVLEIDCMAGGLLDRFAAEGWRCAGTSSDMAGLAEARARGHEVWAADPIDLLRAIPPERRFDVVFLSQVLERQAEPLTVLQRAARLVEPGGVLVLSTANLDSAQIDCFGPAWAHWHPPYHRFLLSRRTVTQMAAASGLELARCRSFSHPYWTWLSLRLSDYGLAAAVPHGIAPDPPTAARASTLALASRLFYDWRGRGDYFYAVLRPAGTRPVSARR